LCCPHRHGSLRGDARERHILLQVRAERLVAIQGALSLLLRQLGQVRAGYGVIWGGCHAAEYAKQFSKSHPAVRLLRRAGKRKTL
jgi:hypothetical protein